MGRPKKQPAERRTVSLSCRLTPAERVRLETAATQVGLSTSEYIRRQALDGRVVIRQRRALDHASFDQLRRIGVNLNQLTRIANQRGFVPDAVSRAAEAVERAIADAVEPGGDGSSPAAKRGSACDDPSSET
jgi:uncharacterized protein (DUF1778 family)